MALIIRNDDVSMASNTWDILEMYNKIKGKYPEAKIWTAVTVFSKGREGSLYDEIPLKDRSLGFFYDVDSAWRYKRGFGDKIVSHGLLHVDHTQIEKTAVEMSIVTSCNFLETDTFVPPFGKVNDTVREICHHYGIKIAPLYPDDEWLSIEHNKFDPTHEKWYFHSWRYTPKSFKWALGYAVE
jgi:hypothetical protein